MNYSKQQINAIGHLEGPALVLAVPGAGKTTVLLERINNLIKNKVRPQEILAVTFSKAQALDMEKRYKEKFGNQGIVFSTIHSFAYGIVREYARLRNMRIQIIESSDEINKYRLVERIFFEINKKRINDEELDEFFRVSGFIKNTLLDYEKYKKLYSPSIKNFEKIHQAYESFKRKNGYIDFDDMLLLALDILKKNKSIRENMQKRFKFVQIDEGQDSSLVQLMILSIVAMPENNIFIVADDDQSIYGFRGADARLLLNFNKVYQDAKIYLMEDNYRSGKYIVHYADKLIKNNKNRYQKNIRAKKDHKQSIEINSYRNSDRQAKAVIKKAKKLVEKEETVAILYRNNISSISFIDKLDIDFYIKDGKMAFYSNFIIKDLIDIINFSIDTHDIDSFERIYYKLNMYLKRDFINQIKIMDPNDDVITRLEQCDGINRFYRENFELLSFYCSKIADMDFGEAVQYIISNVGYYDYLTELAKRTKTPLMTYDRIIDTLFNISQGVETVAEFKGKIREMVAKQKHSSQRFENLTLSTVHGAKGLEFDNVFVVDMVQNEFPSAYSLRSDDDLNLLEEERRLFYVAMTRAKKRLYISSPSRLNNRKVEKSQFIDELKKKE